MSLKQVALRGALRWGAMSRSQKLMVAMVPVVPIVITAESCTVVSNFDVVHSYGEHVDAWPQTNFYDQICMIAYGPSAPCWPSNTVWWFEQWYRKVFVYDYGSGQYVWKWVENGSGWVSRECKVYVFEMGERGDGPCYNVWGYQVPFDDGRWPP